MLSSSRKKLQREKSIKENNFSNLVKYKPKLVNNNEKQQLYIRGEYAVEEEEKKKHQGDRTYMMFTSLGDLSSLSGM